MFSPTAAIFFVLVTLPLTALASPAILARASDCNTGPVQCCDSVQPANSPQVLDMFKSLNLDIPINAPVGLNCSPLNVLGGGVSGSCKANPVCCENNQMNGLINTGCVPVSL
ncbi:hypothetical protein EW026_g8276 [Hermanssonia centrifuga]|uniref:Hydrophobin n=2 Tax=Hermanssonia centrifuga TaxID=98765 RepID=A0A2R6NR67_9APHY|nr:hypothetical protein PHLCEN_2v9289 [Hermanssonia centrifuga]THG92724.1 hypothetical protein EW026_g8276 [Hermanssonia centrifuga]